MGDIADIVGGGTPSTNNADYWDGDIDWYAPAEIGDKIFVDSSERKITKEGFENCSAKLLPAGSVLFTSRAGIGKMAILRKESCTNQGFQSIVPHEGELDSYFIFSRSDELKNYGETVGAGSTFVEVSGKQMSNMNLMMPKSYSEQIVIGKYFSQLDDLITLHQRKYNKLLNVKKSMLEKMFPKNGSNIPEIRFKGFTDPWEQRKLEELSSSFEYGLNAAAKEYDGENKYIRITDIDDDSREFKQEDITSPDTDLSSAENYKLSEGDILFARTGASVGKTYIYKASDGLVYYAGFLIRARIKPEYNSEFVFQNTLTGDYEKFIKVTSMRSGQPGVNAQEYSQYQIMLPSKPEQDKISDCLRNLDNLITLHQRELEKLQNIKKSMLEKMFV